MSDKDGGRAFPRTVVATYAGAGYKGMSEVAGDGMTLRDYFAAKWMNTYCIGPGSTKTIQTIAEESYKVADAMLKAREAM